tara:strand:+ start:9340 stop:10059 length:720 start_codon:yes stop_codon:yes gene_type:complete
MLKRKFIALILAIAAIGPAFGQSLVVEAYDSLVTGDALSDNDIYGYGTVKNVSSDTVLVRFKRIDGNYNLLTDNNAICWGICFIESISVSPPSYSVYLAPGDTASASTHVYPDQDDISREGNITYVFFNSDDPSDSAAYSVKYKVEGSGISVKEIATMPELSVYPNPATDRLQVNYSGQSAENSSFEIINLVGSKVYSKSLQSAESSFNLNITNLNPGVYFCVLKVDNKLVTSKKLVVN